MFWSKEYFWRLHWSRVHDIHKFCSPWPIDVIYQKWLKLFERRSWKCLKALWGTDVKWRQTTTDSNILQVTWVHLCTHHCPLEVLYHMLLSSHPNLVNLPLCWDIILHWANQCRTRYHGDHFSCLRACFWCPRMIIYSFSKPLCMKLIH